MAANLPPLSKVDPEAAWKPWKPDKTQPWNLKWAGHLYRRAAFGCNGRELRQAVRQGHAETLDSLLEPDTEKDEQWIVAMGKSGKEFTRNSFQLRSWWNRGMFLTPAPLREKMTLFWHNHFATSNFKVKSIDLMQTQNQLLRTQALGKFGDLLLAISKDPAMLVYLDSNSNVKGKPNENYAREVMELFSLGVGNYTEKDIGEAARAFTGWHATNGTFNFAKEQHDDGEKTVLKQTGNWDGADIVRILLKQDACAQFLVHKLYRAFISESQDPPTSFLEPLCRQLRKSDYDMGALVKTMLRSRHFFSDYAYRQRIKSPVEFAVGAILTVTDRPVPVTADILASKIEPMGQQLFEPPNVKGWPGGKAWLSTATVLARHNFAQKLAAGTLKARPAEGQFSDEELRNRGFEDLPDDDDGTQPPGGVPGKRRDLADQKIDVARLVLWDEPERIADFLLELFLQGGVTTAAREALIEFIAKDDPKDAALDQRNRAAAHAVMTMPEYQLA
jgi:uncharacterized protein (DUF1800 family)